MHGERCHRTLRGRCGEGVVTDFKGVISTGVHGSGEDHGVNSTTFDVPSVVDIESFLRNQDLGG